MQTAGRQEDGAEDTTLATSSTVERLAWLQSKILAQETQENG